MLKFFKTMFKTMFILIFAGILAGVGYAFFVAATAAPIDPANIYEDMNNNSYIYDKNGELISTLHYTENREIVPIDEMPPNLKHAFIAIEDKTFYEHHGFNFKRMIGAIINALKGDEGIQGTSTITQQLARNVYLPNIKSQRSIKRKIIEMYYAWKIEQALTKDQILEAYLNAIYLGYGSYGVGTASDVYFSKKVEDLSLEECAALAALPQAPDTYALIEDREDGMYSNDISKERRYMVLDLMAEQKYISKEDAENAKVPLDDFINPNLSKKNSINTYFCDYVIQEVIKDLEKKKDMTEEEATSLVYSGGLSIVTTLDSNIQNIVYEEFSNDYNFPWAEEEPQAAMVITEVRTGKVLAMMGGRDATGEHLYNRATNPRQPGSSIKPLSVYSAALQKSYECAKNGQPFPFSDYGIDKQGASGWGDYITAGSMVRDEKTYFNGELWPLNANRNFTGYQTFRTALQQSINTCAVKILMQVGIDYSINMVKLFGITTLVEDESVSDENPAALGLGAMTKGVTPLEMALAYATFPNGGVRNSAVCYTAVYDQSGNLLLKGESKETEVLNKGVAWIMTDVLQSSVSRGIAGNAYISGVSVGGKTGTTNDNYDIWFDGFTPKYAASLWIGTDNNYKMSALSSTAAALWSRIMRQIPDITEGEYPEMPSNVIRSGGEYYTNGTASYSRSYRWTGSDDDEDD